MLTDARRLTDADLAALAGLERRVVDADGGRLKLEWAALRGDAGNVAAVLWHAGGKLLGFAGVYDFGDPPEIAGMVDPGARRRGIGTALARRALGLAAGGGAERALFVVPRTTGAGAAFAAFLDGSFEHAEHSLVLGGAPAGGPQLKGVRVRTAGAGDEARIAAVLADAFGGLGHEPRLLVDGERLLVIEHRGFVVGTMRVPVEDGRAGVYGFAVEPASQGRGIGREALRQVCAGLVEKGCREVYLEVEVDNERALGLYTSLGFERRATDDYYALATGAGTAPSEDATMEAR